MYLINGVYEIEQPIYKIQRNGAESLPDDELLTLVLRLPQRNGSDVLAKCQMNGWAWARAKKMERADA